jgi:hypothetical protein
MAEVQPGALAPGPDVTNKQTSTRVQLREDSDISQNILLELKQNIPGADKSLAWAGE